ncbi:protein ADM2 preproprotein [Rattus norvegicus]|uniref:Protein ADM2 n=1 Tax=Rattus norvegicus TaxID=10116 RepID=ADM2_RAT|nr:protein ADM2 preproprotein [Rattus norvegicus]XP_032746797.1 protein ADM2 [Rattus rattus]P61312.1 RecName: Full=Protein ADM2; AltName: Full=Intermedin; Contains: RecName: Full=Adrenomedullin-2; Short=AM2; AltName: Full=Intermedin-long; Short=IMDL; Contains: RecName: Full=Intermedin-short; Short=IMDS; Flags: Precursor [Rattus norvegicus]AAT01302.1 intermedin peptide precursor [Rattus norvegicus]BAD07413.1 adrenomedullin 2 [Rattus norvegicus]BAD22678.1 adrenomedullin 2 [Rattus norvegicus]|eukprot:NP_958829.1 ADM2 precursor [Rattus norvegicus]
MAQLLMVTVTFGCISLLYLLPGTLSGSLGKGLRPREPPAKIPSSGPQPGHPSLRPVVWKPPHALQPQGRGNPALATVHLPQGGGSRHPGPQRHVGSRRPHAQLLRVGCVLGTCQVQNLSHRLWQLVRPSGRRDSAPVDPSSPHSYG